jgi:hypothetical protein
LAPPAAATVGAGGAATVSPDGVGAVAAPSGAEVGGTSLFWAIALLLAWRATVAPTAAAGLSGFDSIV